MSAHQQTKTNNHKKLKFREGDGGFWVVLIGFIGLLAFWITRADYFKQFFNPAIQTKEVWLGAIIILDFYGGYRKVHYHDYTPRHNVTVVLRWFSMIFAFPGLLYYLIITH